MLDVTILKVLHETVTRARDALKYIQSCDVFSPEAGFLTEREAEQVERAWQQALDEDWSRTRYNKDLPFEPTDPDPSIRAYQLKTMEYAFLEKRPLWMLERFDKDGEALLKAYAARLRAASQCCRDALGAGNIESFFEEYWKEARDFNEGKVLRDQHMGKQLDNAEARIRQRYPQYQNKEPIRVLTYIGAAHEPEAYTQIPVRLVSLDAYDKGLHAREQCTPEVRRQILVKGILKVFTWLPVLPQNVPLLSFDELVAVAKESSAYAARFTR